MAFYDIVRSLSGNRLGLSVTNRLIAPAGLVLGSKGSNIVLPSPTHRAVFFDFDGDVVEDQLNFTEGSDNTTSDGAIVESAGGVFRLTAGDSAGTVAADGAQLNSALNWKASSGELVFQARIKLASIASVSCFIGLTDTKSLEQPIHSAASANTITTNATDAVGVFFDTNMDADTWWLAGVKNDTDATHQNSGYAPVADTYETFRVEVDTSGDAVFFRNGLQIGSKMTGAVTASVALTPVFIIRPLSAAAGKTMDIDYFNVSCLRA